MAKRNEDSVTGTVTKPCARKSGLQIPAQARDCSLLQNIKTGYGPSVRFNEQQQTAFPGAKQMG